MMKFLNGFRWTLGGFSGTLLWVFGGLEALNRSFGISEELWAGRRRLCSY